MAYRCPDYVAGSPSLTTPQWPGLVSPGLAVLSSRAQVIQRHIPIPTTALPQPIHISTISAKGSSCPIPALSVIQALWLNYLIDHSRASHERELQRSTSAAVLDELSCEQYFQHSINQACTNNFENRLPTVLSMQHLIDHQEGFDENA